MANKVQLCPDCNTWYEAPYKRDRCFVCAAQRKKKLAREYSRKKYVKKARVENNKPRAIPTGMYVITATPIKLSPRYRNQAVLDAFDIGNMMKQDELPIGAKIEHETGTCYIIACEPGNKNLVLQEC